MGKIADIQPTRLLALIDTIKTSFWFIPSLLVIGSLCAAALFISLDRFAHLNQLDAFELLYQIKADAARELLTTIASSMMTVVSITFSITIVSLTLASSQFGPRLIRNFMNDTSTQVVLGLFIADFVYCLAIVRAIDAFADSDYVPGLSILWCLLITLFSVFVLIYFIHHVARSIQADNVIDDVYCQLQSSVDSLFPLQAPSNDINNAGVDQLPDYSRKQSISVKHSGYLQAIDFNGLVKRMQQHDCFAQVTAKIGDFVVEQQAVIEIHSDSVPKQALYEEALKCLTIGAKRSPIQDPEFAVHQLVEVALRALSPGVNDPYTAITCVDKLTATLCKLSSQTFPQTGYFDNKGSLRLYYQSITYSGIGNAAFDQIRQYSSTSLAVSIRQLESLMRLCDMAHNDQHLNFIHHQAGQIEQGLAKQSISDSDWQDIKTRLDIIRSKLS
ncbi:DUF2254 domain-containing protein [Neptunicella marina]|uniref:DUF2254 domain-containing protein n=1 Tax=Neptunicella marina TaxID=2125989 RepID=A0A8J6LYB9_9ALTE|nr:DUF2254 domain-containing protein [Neptunicella marina]MBC3765275.1 DUF2254 domain-containing protein [Neptunicella marina]